LIVQHSDSGIWFDADAVSMAETLIGTLTLTKATKSQRPEPFELLRHSRKLIANLLGWKRADGTRMYTKAYASMGRKQAKTQTIAALAVVEFFLNPEPEQEIYMAATDRDQATICFDAVASLIRHHEDLSALVQVTDSRKLIKHKQTGSIIRALSSDGSGKHGYNPSLTIMDELHAWGAAEQELYDALTTGSMSRRNPLLVMITTAGSSQESICYREYKYAKQILNGDIKDDSYFPMIYEVPHDADWTDKSLWPLALPLLETGHHTYQKYEKEFEQALVRPALQNKFRRLYLNQWTSVNTQWIPIRQWDACIGEIPDLTGVPCYGGLDLAAVRDLTAFALCWPYQGKVYYKAWGYVPEAAVQEKSQSDGVRYDIWAEHGHVRLTPGNTTDWRYVVAHIKDLAEQYRIEAIAFDRWGARDTAAELQAAGLKVIEFGQGFGSMSPAAKRFESLVHEQTLVHDGNPVLRWCLDCTEVMHDPAGNIKPVHSDRRRDSSRNDLAIAAVMATGIMVIGPDSDRSVYEDRMPVSLSW
jgi:phage terminase large subunit-like protein